MVMFHRFHVIFPSKNSDFPPFPWQFNPLRSTTPHGSPGQPAIEPGHVLQQRRGGRVQIDAHGVHAGHGGATQLLTRDLKSQRGERGDVVQK